MTIEESVSLTKWVITISIPIIVTVTVGIISYINKQAKQIYELKEKQATMDERLKAEELLMGHTVRAGENIKTQLGNHELMIHEIKTDFKYMKESLDRILKILEPV